jgi:hypothetical protein
VILSTKSVARWDIINDFSQLNLGRGKMNQINLYSTFNVNLILNRTTVYSLYEREADLIISAAVFSSSQQFRKYERRD